MATVRFEITMSLDGYVAGPNQSQQFPLDDLCVGMSCGHEARASMIIV
jgi:hypothetical protein